MRQKLEAKENLLQDCEREIRHIRAQYQLIDEVLQTKSKPLQQTSANTSSMTPVHGLLQGLAFSLKDFIDELELNQRPKDNRATLQSSALPAELLSESVFKTV